MVSDPSSLTTHNLSVVKKFNVFDEFREDFSSADASISKEATNALKYVKSNFVPRIGGYRKSKLINYDAPGWPAILLHRKNNLNML